MEDLANLEIGIAIGREVRPATAEVGKYIDPPHAVIMKDITGLGLTHQDVVFTSVCWLVDKRLPEMPLHKVVLNEAQQEEIRSVMTNPLSDQLLIFIGMSGLMTLAKEVKKTQPEANIEYLKLRWKALCATT